MILMHVDWYLICSVVVGGLFVCSPFILMAVHRIRLARAPVQDDAEFVSRAKRTGTNMSAAEILWTRKRIAVYLQIPSGKLRADMSLDDLTVILPPFDIGLSNLLQDIDQQAARASASFDQGSVTCVMDLLEATHLYGLR
jgi:hypothetical protein